MPKDKRCFSYWQTPTLLAGILVGLLTCPPSARAQVSGTTDVNLSRKTADDSECAIAKNPLNKLQLFVACNNTGGPGLFAARSVDGGMTWSYPDATDLTIADGDAGQGAAACCDPTLAWDTFGNLFITYIDANVANIVTILSTDGGATFTDLASFPGSVDQPTVVAAETQDTTAPVAVWIVWNQSGQMVARGARVTGLGAANVSAFNALQTIPGTSGCSFGDVAIAPSGAVVQACESPVTGEGPASILVSTDADGFGPNNFGNPVTATTTNVGGFDFIPAQNARSVDAEAGLAFDTRGTSPHFGRLYLVYTEETTNENNDTDIMLRFSDDTGATWSAPIRVNDDPASPIRSQFLPKISVNPLSSNIGVCWHDARNSATNTAIEVFCSIATRLGVTPTFMANARISDGASTSNGLGIEFGDYSGLAYFQGVMHPAWADTSNSGGLNPDGNANFDAYTDRVMGGAASIEGDPHIITVDGIHYDFQGGGEYVVLRDGDGLEIQTRQTPVPTAGIAGPNPYTGLATCVSLNTAVAARVGTHHVSYQPRLDGVPDPNSLELRVDGEVTTLSSAGLDLGSGGRVTKTPGGGIQIEFPNGTLLSASPGWWSSQSTSYLNVDVLRTPSIEGLMGAIMPGSWLPGMPDGTSLGPKPASLHQRYVDLHEKFGNAWRVTDATSLFEYAPGISTATFTVRSWPTENGPCVVPGQAPVKPVTVAVAEAACAGVKLKAMHADCVFDVATTGNTGFAKTYLLSQKTQRGATTTILADDPNPSQVGEWVPFTAVVSKAQWGGREVPSGRVEFTLDGAKAGEPVKLDAQGRATWETSRLKVGKHRVAARYIPATDAFLASSSLEVVHFVKRCSCEPSAKR